MHMAMNEKNLTSITTPEEARKMGSKGGVKSGEARRRKRELRQRLEALLEIRREDMDGLDALALALYEKAISGDTRAIEICMAIIGETPRQTVNFKIRKLEKAADAPKITAALLKAVANGEISPDEGQKIASLAALHLKAIETGELEARVAAIEEGRQ